ncbi:hypothetical protein pb186bvf_001528 [Paramecium bursaria]
MYLVNTNFRIVWKVLIINENKVMKFHYQFIYLYLKNTIIDIQISYKIHMLLNINYNFQQLNLILLQQVIILCTMAQNTLPKSGLQQHYRAHQQQNAIFQDLCHIFYILKINEKFQKYSLCLSQQISKFAKNMIINLIFRAS